MKTLKYTKALPGPVLTSALLEEDYDFTTGVAMVSPKDARTILTRLGPSFTELEPTTVSKTLAFAVADGGSPVFAAATIVGRALQITFTEDTALQEVAQNALTVKVGGNAVAVSQVFTGARVVRANLAAAVVASSVVTVSYSNSAIKDALGNAASVKVDQAVTNNTPDVTLPVYASSVIDGNTLVMTYTEDMALHEANKAVPADFAVMFDGSLVTVNTVTVNGSAKTITLVLASTAVSTDLVSLSYTKSSHTTAFTQDTAGNAAANLTNEEVTNETVVDDTAPVIDTLEVDGGTLVMTYTEAIGLHETNKAVPADFEALIGGVESVVTSVTVNGSAKTVTLALTTPVVFGDTVTLSYTKSVHATAYIQDTSGNAAADLVAEAVSNNTADVTAPVIDTLEVDGSSLVMTYTEDDQLDETNKAVVGDFAVVINAIAVDVTAVTVDGAAKTVTLTMASAASSGHVVTLSYTKSAHETAYIQDRAGNAAADLTDEAVTNVTA